MNLTLDPALESLLAFWAEAGVDAAIEDAPVDKLRRREPSPPGRPPVERPVPAPALAVSGDFAELARSARSVAAQAGDLSALQRAAEELDAGRLRPASATITFFRADAATDVAVLGGAPGETEAREHAAFAGAEGRLLDRMLASVGLGGRALRLHAALWSRPGGEAASVEELELARPFLDRALALARPKAVLLLGDQPARVWLGATESFLKLRGQTSRIQPEGVQTPLPAVVTFHPGLLLRQPMAKKQAWRDLLTLGDRVASANDAP